MTAKDYNDLRSNTVFSEEVWRKNHANLTLAANKIAASRCQFKVGDNLALKTYGARQVCRVEEVVASDVFDAEGSPPKLQVRKYKNDGMLALNVQQLRNPDDYCKVANPDDEEL